MTDIILDTDAQLLSFDGDILQGDGVNQHLLYLIASAPGHWKEFPLVGVGIYNYLQGTVSPLRIERDIIAQLKADVFPNPLVNARDFPTIIVNNIVIQIG